MSLLWKNFDYQAFLHRLSLWMATGSGKTLVLIKLMECLFHLIQKGHLPEKDFLLMAPKDDILKQIKQHINIFNQRSAITIELVDVRKYERTKNIIRCFLQIASTFSIFAQTTYGLQY